MCDGVFGVCRAARKIQRLARMYIAICKVDRVRHALWRAQEAERVRLEQLNAANRIGFYYRRHKEKKSLNYRFGNRRKVPYCALLSGGL